jgi:hypothetical protein
MDNLLLNSFTIIPGIETPLAVPVLTAATLKEEVFRKDWVAKNKPCLIKGAVKHWPAVQKWRNKSYWLENCGNFEVNVYPHQNFIDRKRQEAGHEKMLFHDAIERLFQNRDYVFSMPGEQIMDEGRFAGVKKDLGGFTFLPNAAMPRYYERLRFFIYRRAATNWHYHGVDETLMCQVNGVKRVALLSPQIPRSKYVTEFLKNESYLDGATLDKTHDLRPLITDVEEGDALYIPPYWHHVVVPGDGEIGFTLAFCWRSPLHILGNFSNFFVRDLYRSGMRPFSLNTILLPFLGCYAGLLYCIKKISGKI